MSESSKLSEKGEEYTCAVCEGRFFAGVTQAEATAESERTFDQAVTPETHDTVCDDCWKELLEWYSKFEEK